MEVMLIVMAVILFIGMIADKEADNRKNYTLGFVVVVVATVFGLSTFRKVAK